MAGTIIAVLGIPFAFLVDAVIRLDDAVGYISATRPKAMDQRAVATQIVYGQLEWAVRPLMNRPALTLLR